MDKMKLQTPDLTAQNVEKLAALFPNCVTEMKDENGTVKKGINFALLKQMLSGDVVEGDEAYEFTWVGKKASIVEANKPIRKTLRPCKDESLNWDTTENLYIEGDNLEVLKLLQESYLGQVKMIYIDPPYNTESDSFVYPDSYRIEDDEYNMQTGAVNENGDILFRENSKSSPKFHSKWCSMIYERLLLARNILSNEGAIFIHIDEHEDHVLSMICDEVFGYDNNLGTIIWDKRNPKGSVIGIAYQHESILVYCKDITKFACVPFSTKKEHAATLIAKSEALIKKYGGVNNFVRDEFQRYIKQQKNELTGGESAYCLIDDKGKVFRTVSMAAPDKPETRSHRPLIHPLTGKPCAVPAKGWRFTDETMDKMLKAGKIEFGKDETTVPNQKYYLDENMWEAVSSLLYFGGSGDAMALPFDNPKPIYIAKKLISSLCKSDGDIILDMFSGSATAAHAVLELNSEDLKKRTFIMIQYPEVIKPSHDAYKQGFKKITDIGKERIRRAGAKIKADNPEGTKDLDVGFRVFKLDESNMNDVYYAAGEYSQDMLSRMESNIKPDRTDLDLLFGCLLDWGLPLSMPYTSETIDGCTVHTYNGGDLIACFDENVPETVVKEIARRKPLRAVFRDHCFADSPARINVGEIFKMLAPDTRVKVI